MTELEKIYNNYFKDFETNGLTTLRAIEKTDTPVQIRFEIQHHNADPEDVFNYTCIFVRDGEVIEVFADGEKTLWQVLREANKVFNGNIFEDMECPADEVGIDCFECGYCEEEEY